MKKEKLQLTSQKHKRSQEQTTKKPYPNKIDNLEEMENFSEMYNLSRLNQEETEKMNHQITSSEIRSFI